MSRFRPLIFVLIGLVLAGASAAAPAQRQPIDESRTSSDGVAWRYQEYGDTMDDRWQVVLSATLPEDADEGDASLFLVCFEGQRPELRIFARGWETGDRQGWPLLIRVDQQPAFTVQAMGHVRTPNIAHIRNWDQRQAAIRGLIEARERIAFRDDLGRTIVFPLGERPEVARAIARCIEMGRAAAP